MQFLLHIEVTWPPDGDPDEKDRRIAAEAVRARELRRGRHQAPVADPRPAGELGPLGGA